MANKTGSQPEVKFCPSCKGELRNIPRSEMRSKRGAYQILGAMDYI